MEQLIGLALIVIGLGGLYAFLRRDRTRHMTDAQFREHFKPPSHNGLFNTTPINITPGMRVSGAVEGIITEVYTGGNDLHRGGIDEAYRVGEVTTVGDGVATGLYIMDSVSPPTDTNIGGGFDAGTN